jgi:hypothetical protein
MSYTSRGMHDEDGFAHAFRRADLPDPGSSGLGRHVGHLLRLRVALRPIHPTRRYAGIVRYGDFVRDYSAANQNNTSALSGVNLTLTSTALGQSDGFTTDTLVFGNSTVSLVDPDPRFSMSATGSNNVVYTLDFAWSTPTSNLTTSSVMLSSISAETQQTPNSGPTLNQFANNLGMNASGLQGELQSITLTVVPEPSSFVLASSALAMILGGARLRRRAVASRLARA